MNETPVTGGAWPPVKERRLRLAEAIKLIRALWTRGAGRLRGRVLPRPEGDDLRPARRAGADLRRRVGAAGGRSSPAASATASSARAARTPSSTTSCSARCRRAPRRRGATPPAIARMIEIKVSYDRDRGCAERRVPLVGRAGAVRRGEERRRGPDRDGAARRRRGRPRHSRFIVSDDPDEVVRGSRRTSSSGSPSWCFHFPGDDQRAPWTQFAEDVLPRLRERFG